MEQDGKRFPTKVHPVSTITPPIVITFQFLLVGSQAIKLSSRYLQSWWLSMISLSNASVPSQKSSRSRPVLRTLSAITPEMRQRRVSEMPNQTL
jgi:hypothetical protein